MTEGRFFDLDQILAEEEELQIELRCDVNNGDSLEYGQVSLSDEAGTLPMGTRPRVPCWLGLALAGARFAQVQLPRWLGEAHLSRVLADPESANLREKCNYFYELGAQLCARVEGKTGGLLAEVFLERAKKLLMLVLLAQEQAPGGELLPRLASAEQRMLARAQEFMLEYRLWRSGKALAEAGRSTITRLKRAKTV